MCVVVYLPTLRARPYTTNVPLLRAFWFPLDGMVAFSRYLGVSLRVFGGAGPKDHINNRALHSAFRAQDKENSRNWLEVGRILLCM